MNVGILSDTHNFLDSRIPSLFAGVDHILHAGDIGMPSILSKLQSIAPVTAVSGNTDDPGHRYPLTARIDLGSTSFLLHHIVNPQNLTTDLQRSILRETPDVVVFGHTHEFSAETVGDVLFFNPGFAGGGVPRYDRSVAIITLDANGVSWKKILL